MTDTTTRPVPLRIGWLPLLMVSWACQSPNRYEPSPAPTSTNEQLVARAASLELDTEYIPPPGDALEHHTSGFAKILCSAVFITGLDSVFEPVEGLTAAFIVTWKGRIIGERYRNGITMHTPLESWSMGKSLTTALLGILIQQSVYDLWQPAPIPQWQAGGDPRAEIRIADILRMSSGLRFRADFDPGYDPSLGYPDHLYVYTGSVNSFEWAATRPQQWPPNTVGRYHNSDPVLVNYLIRLAVEKRGEEYLSFPQRALFDKIGIRNMVLETDPYGNFLLQGYEFGTGRDSTRQPLSPGWYVDGRADLARRLRRLRHHGRPRLGGRRPARLRRILLAQPRSRLSDS